MFNFTEIFNVLIKQYFRDYNLEHVLSYVNKLEIFS